MHTHVNPVSVASTVYMWALDMEPATTSRCYVAGRCYKLYSSYGTCLAPHVICTSIGLRCWRIPEGLVVFGY